MAKWLKHSYLNCEGGLNGKSFLVADVLVVRGVGDGVHRVPDFHGDRVAIPVVVRGGWRCPGTA